MNGISMFFKSIWDKTGQSDFQKSWSIERARAAKYGPSHVNEIDAIFSRHLESK